MSNVLHITIFGYLTIHENGLFFISNKMDSVGYSLIPVVNSNSMTLEKNTNWIIINNILYKSMLDSNIYELNAVISFTILKESNRHDYIGAVLEYKSYICDNKVEKKYVTIKML